jgi:septal ring factor EnvC (AmiA/AmiB activator)
MYAWTIITGLMIAVNVMAAILGGLGKKSLKRSVVRLEKIREARVARLKVLKKRRKSMDGTRNFMRRRRDDLKRLVSEQEHKYQRLEEGEELEEDEELTESEGDADRGEEAVEEKADKTIRSWMDRKDDTDEDKGWREEKKIRTRFDKEGGEGIV